MFARFVRGFIACFFWLAFNSIASADVNDLGLRELIKVWEQAFSSQPTGYRSSFSVDSVSFDSLNFFDGDYALQITESKKGGAAGRSIVMLNQLYSATISSNETISSDENNWLIEQLSSYGQPDFSEQVSIFHDSRYWNFAFHFSIEDLINCESSELKKKDQNSYEIEFYAPTDGIKLVRYVVTRESNWMPVNTILEFSEDSGAKPGFQREIALSQWYQYRGQMLYAKVAITNKLKDKELARVEYLLKVEDIAQTLDRKECFLAHYGLTEPSVGSQESTFKFAFYCVGIVVALALLLATVRYFR